MYEFWIDADHFFNIFSLYGRERDKYTENGTAEQIVRKRDCPAESGTVGMYETTVVTTTNKEKNHKWWKHYEEKPQMMKKPTNEEKPQTKKNPQMKKTNVENIKEVTHEIEFKFFSRFSFA